jgi:hypothetical protein
MSNLTNIHQEIMQAPTVMRLQMERDFCERITKLPPDEIAGHWDLMTDILGRLHESHTDTFYEVTPNDDFSFFVDWARAMARQPQNAKHATGLLGVADMFTVVPY